MGWSQGISAGADGGQRSGGEPGISLLGAPKNLEPVLEMRCLVILGSTSESKIIITNSKIM